MPKDAGRTGNPGNDRVMRSVDVSMPHPELLQPGSAKPIKSVSEVLGRNKVPSFKKGQFMKARIVGNGGKKSKGNY